MKISFSLKTFEIFSFWLIYCNINATGRESTCSGYDRSKMCGNAAFYVQPETRVINMRLRCAEREFYIYYETKVGQVSPTSFFSSKPQFWHRKRARTQIRSS